MRIDSRFSSVDVNGSDFMTLKDMLIGAVLVIFMALSGCALYGGYEHEHPYQHDYYYSYPYYHGDYYYDHDNHNYHGDYDHYHDHDGDRD
jgi:hypothetical protein